MNDKPTPLTPIQAILQERQRQQLEEGHTADADDAHNHPEYLARAAASYALSGSGKETGGRSYWPWPEGFKPKDPYRDLVRAGALIVAALEQMQRRATDQILMGEGQ